MILIASCSKDMGTLGPVLEVLKKHKAKVVTYFADDVAQGKVAMSYNLSLNGTASFMYDGKHFKSSDVQRAWYRRPNFFSVAEPDNVKLLYLDGQRKDTQTHMWRSIPNERWLNAPDAIKQTNDKCLQMKLAHDQGMVIPNTVISNNWDEIFDLLKTDEVILKMPYGILYEEDGSKFLASTIVKRSERSKLARTNPFPGLWQEYVPKKREWRVTVVGERVFAVVIYTKHESRDDWRKHQFKSGLVEFKKGSLPEEVAQQCIKVVCNMGLRYGAIDLIEKPSGEFVFLEVNANGQYQWLVDELSLEVPEAIADELLRVISA